MELIMAVGGGGYGRHIPFIRSSPNRSKVIAQPCTVQPREKGKGRSRSILWILRLFIAVVVGVGDSRALERKGGQAGYSDQIKVVVYF